MTIAIALAALAVSVVALVLPIWRARHAFLSVTLDEYHLPEPTRGESVHPYRLVIRNSGPSSAHDIRVDTFGASGPNSDSFFPAGREITKLHAGEEFHMWVEFSLAEETPRRAKLTWTTRGRPHEQEMLVSQRPVL